MWPQIASHGGRADGKPPEDRERTARASADVQLVDLDQGMAVQDLKSRHRSRLCRVVTMKSLFRAVLAIMVAFASLGAMSERPREAGVTDGEIRIGNLMPY